MTDLSPAAQAVRDALEEWISSDFVRYELRKAAIVLRAAADQVVPQTKVKPQQDLESKREAMEWGMSSQTQLTRHQLLAIAAELETQQPTSLPP